MLQKGDEPIPGYRLEQFLGRGQFGEVWRASSPGRASVALKFLNLSERQGLKEFRAIQRIKSIRTHPHLAPITALWLLDEDGRVLSDDVVDSYGEEPDQARQTLLPRKTTGLLDGSPQRMVVATLLCDKNLMDRLEECRAAGQTGIPADELMRYMEEAAKGIDFLNSPHHDLGAGPVAVQHCDIKPENIMLAGGSVMICDYGVARVLADAHAAATGTSMGGSPAYMAPECIDRRPSHASDQYSLAITYYELRAGQLPFSTDSYIGVLEAHRSGKLELSGLPAAECEVIRKATAVDPQQRYPTTEAMVRALRRAIEAGDGVASPARGSRRTTAALLAVGLGCIVLLTVLLVRNVWFPNGQGGPGENGFGGPLTVTLSIEPPSAEVFIDGTAESVTPDGRLTISRPAEAELEIHIAHEGYLALTERVRMAELNRRDEPLRLAPDAGFFAGRAYEAMRAGPVDGEQFQRAVQDYCKAIQINQEAYAVAPSFRQTLGTSGSHEFTINCLAGTQDYRWLAAREGLQSVVLWDLNNLTEKNSPAPAYRRLHEHETRVVNLVVQDPYIVSAGLNEEVAVTMLRPDGTGERMEPPDQLRGWHVAVGGITDEPWVVAGDLHGVVTRYLLAAGGSPAVETLHDPEDDGEEITGIVVTPDQHVVVAGADDTVRVFPPGATAASSAASATVLARTTADVRGLISSPDGRLVAFSQEVTVADRYPVWIAGPGTAQVRELPGGALNRVTSLTFDSSSQSLVCGTERGELQVWENAPALLDGRSSGSPHVLGQTVPGEIQGITFAPASWVVAGVNARDRAYVGLWHLTDPDRPPLLLPLPGEGNKIGNVVVTDEWIIAGCTNGQIVFWELRHAMLVKQACDQEGIVPREPSAGSTLIHS